MKPREYEGPLETPEDWAFAEAMARLARGLANPKGKRENEDGDK